MLGAPSGLGGVGLEEDLQLGRVTVGGDDEVSHLMKTGVRAIAVNRQKQRDVLLKASCVGTRRRERLRPYFSSCMVRPCRLLGCRRR